VLPIVRGKSFFEVMVDTSMTHGQPVEGNQHPGERPYPVQGRSLVLLRHPRPLDPFAGKEPDGGSSVLETAS